MVKIDEAIYDPFLPEKWPDPIPTYKTLLKDYPIYYLEKRDLWIISRYEDVLNSLKNWKVFSSGLGGNSIRDGINKERVGNTLGTTDPPKHTKLRRIVGEVFTPRYVNELEPEIRRIAREFIAIFKDRGEFDAQSDFSYPFTARVVGKMIGVEDEDIDYFVSSISGGLVLTPEQKDNPAFLHAKFKELADFCAKLVERKSSNPGNDVISQLLSAEIEGERLTIGEIGITSMTLVQASFQSTALAIGCSMSTIANHPDQLAEVHANHALIPAMIEETLRYDGTTIGFKRTTSEAVELHGTVIPKGASVYLHYGAANHDERQFLSPERFDIHRENNKHLGFGAGMHTCIGAPLARLMIRVAYEELLPVIGRRYQVKYDQSVLSSFPSFRGYVKLPISF